MVIFEINEGRCSSNLASNNLQRDIEHVVVVVERGVGLVCEATDFDGTMRHVGTSTAINGTLELCVSTLSAV